MTIIDAVAFLLSFLCLCQLLFVRIAMSSWRTVQARYLIVYVGYAAVHYGVIYFAVTRGVSIYAVILGATQVLWLWNTHADWKSGVPDHMRTDSAPLGPPEVKETQP